MLEIVAIRHLPTCLNVKGILQGRIDEDIAEPSEEVLAKVNNNMQELASLRPFDMRLSSTLRRAITTANIYGSPDVAKDPLLDELDFGEYEGRLRSDMESLLGDAWRNEPQTVVLGESIMDLEKRVRIFINKYYDCHRILVFGHGAWIRAMLSLSKYGHIGEMNKIVVENNALVMARFFK